MTKTQLLFITTNGQVLNFEPEFLVRKGKNLYFLFVSDSYMSQKKEQ